MSSDTRPKIDLAEASFLTPFGSSRFSTFVEMFG